MSLVALGSDGIDVRDDTNLVHRPTSTKAPLTVFGCTLGRDLQEILVTRSNLEDKNSLMVELKNKVDELALHNEYQLRLKDMNYSEKIKVCPIRRHVLEIRCKMCYIPRRKQYKRHRPFPSRQYLHCCT